MSSDIERAPEVLRIWQALASAEVEGYLTHLLRRYAFEPEWAEDVRRLTVPWPSGISVAQMRYACGEAIRTAVDAFARSKGNRSLTRKSLRSSLVHRTQQLRDVRGHGKVFTPPPGYPRSALSTVFLVEVARIGDAYWLIPPSVEVVKLHQRMAG
ncbi:hypothetical protein ACQQ2N_17425 [Dokdonella sp. MW10]|uniref:hypothetical protein n=1 Tax=Dokdonella sp. MW10 TaxID=2992926 RepID=UPI003F80CCA1